MRNNLLFCLFFSLLLVACESSQNDSGHDATLDQITKKLSEKNDESPIENARERVQWAGTYQGILPCQRCDGVSTMLVLKPDQSYVIRTQMLGVDLKDKVSKGRFHWLTDNSSIVLEGKEQMKVFRIFNDFGEFRLPNGDPIPVQNRHELQLRKTD